MDDLRIAEGLQIFGESLVGEVGGATWWRWIPEHAAEKELRIAADEPLRKSPGLGEEVPVESHLRRVAVDACELLVCGLDVEHGKPVHPRRMVERHAIGHAPAAVMAGHEERREAEPLHHLYLVGRHRALRVRAVVVSIRRVRAGAVSAQVGRNHGEVPGQTRRDLVPHGLVLRVAVEEEQWRPGTSAHQVDLRLTRPNALVREPFEHRRSSLGAVRRAERSRDQPAFPDHLVTR